MLWKRPSTSPYSSMITTAGIVKVIIKYSRTAVPEGYSNKRTSSKYLGIPFLNYNTITPFGKAKMDYLITDLKIKPPKFLIHDNPTLPVYLSFVKLPTHRAGLAGALPVIKNLKLTKILSHLIFSKIFRR